MAKMSAHEENFPCGFKIVKEEEKEKNFKTNRLLNGFSINTIIINI